MLNSYLYTFQIPSLTLEMEKEGHLDLTMGLRRTNILICFWVTLCLLIVCGIHEARAIPTLRADALLSRDEAIVEPPDCTIEGDEGL